jgi:hypothetical protein
LTIGRGDATDGAATYHAFSLPQRLSGARSKDMARLSTLVLHRHEHAVVAFHCLARGDAPNDWFKASPMTKVELAGLHLDSVGYCALSDSANLTSVTAPLPCTLGDVNADFLARTPKLTTFSFHNIRITTLRSRALYNSGIVTLDLDGLHLTAPSGTATTSLGNGAFQCPNLTSVVVTSPCALGAVGDYFLAKTPKLSSFSFSKIDVLRLGPDLLTGSGLVTLDFDGLQLTSLGDCAVNQCPNLTSVSSTSPCRLGIVGSDFVANSPKLLTMSFSNISIAALGHRALNNSGICTLDLGGLHLTSLGDFAFRCCRSLTSVFASSPCTLGVVGSHFLSHTSSLTSLSFHNISITTLQSFALTQSGLVSLDFGGLHLTPSGWR